MWVYAFICVCLTWHRPSKYPFWKLLSGKHDSCPASRFGLQFRCAVSSSCGLHDDQNSKFGAWRTRIPTMVNENGWFKPSDLRRWNTSIGRQHHTAKTARKISWQENRWSRPKTRKSARLNQVPGLPAGRCRISVAYMLSPSPVSHLLLCMRNSSLASATNPDFFSNKSQFFPKTPPRVMK